MRLVGIVLCVLAVSAVPLAAQSRDPEDALLDVLVWGTYMSIKPEVYPPPRRLEWVIQIVRNPRTAFHFPT